MLKKSQKLLLGKKKSSFFGSLKNLSELRGEKKGLGEFGRIQSSSRGENQNKFREQNSLEGQSFSLKQNQGWEGILGNLRGFGALSQRWNSGFWELWSREGAQGWEEPSDPSGLGIQEDGNG